MVGRTAQPGMVREHGARTAVPSRLNLRQDHEPSDGDGDARRLSRAAMSDVAFFTVDDGVACFVKEEIHACGRGVAKRQLRFRHEAS